MTDLLIPTSSYRELTIDEVLRRKAAIDAQLPHETSPAPPEPSSLSPDLFSIEDVEYGYRLRNVSHRGKLYDMDWCGSFLPGRARGSPERFSQDVWTSDGGYRTFGGVVFDVPSIPEYASTILALYKYRDTVDAMQRSILHDLRDLLADDFRNNGLMTSTRTISPPHGNNDVIWHCYGRKPNSEQYKHLYDNNNRTLRLDASMTREATALLDTDAPQEFNDAIQWLLGKSLMIYRCVNVTDTIDSAMILDGSGDDLIIADISLAQTWPVRGIKVREVVAPSSTEAARYG